MLRIRSVMFVALSLGLAGCKPPPPYVGTYDLQMTAQVKAWLADVQAGSPGKPDLTPEERQNGAKNAERISKGFKGAVTLYADGTYKFHNPLTDREKEGSYKVEGTKVTVTFNNGEIVRYVFSAADQTLIQEGQSDPSIPSLILKKD